MRTSSAFKIVGLSLLLVTGFGFLDLAYAAPELPTFMDVIERGIEIPEGKPGMKPRDPRPTIFQSARRSLSSSEERLVRYKTAQLLDAGFYEVEGRDFGAPNPAELEILTVDASFNNESVEMFLRTLSDEKFPIMQAFKLSNSEYNRLAILAFGILGMESKFGESAKYKIKERCQACVTARKLTGLLMRNVLRGKFTGRVEYKNSRGPTQIKVIPKQIQELYPEVTVDTLNDPRHAAIATVGFLANLLNEMKVRVAYNRGKEKNYDYINQSNVYDYIMYAYFGSMHQLRKDLATPAENPYISGINRPGEERRLGLRDHIRFLILLERQQIDFPALKF